MIVTKSNSALITFADDSISLAMQKINENKLRIIFVVSAGGHLEGVLTDGDLRRWLLKQSEIDLSTVVSMAMNREFLSAHESTSRSDLEALFSETVLALPIVDSSNRLVAVALREAPGLQFGDHLVADDQPCFIIAEIGNNHNGSLESAMALIDLAAEAGVDCAKFQMRDMSAMYRETDGNSEASEDLGAQYTLDLLSKFQLSDDELFRAFDYCSDKGLIPLCTPWDPSSLEKLDRYGMSGFKVASADFTNHQLLANMAATGKPLICSTGMSTEDEIIETVNFLNHKNTAYALLHCNSTYPTPYKDVDLKYLPRLKELAGGIVGYSGHERGFHVPLAAVAMGAKIVEKHFTTDRSLEGNDHKVSLLPQELSSMVRQIRQLEDAMGEGRSRTLSQGELMNREVLAKSLIANVDIPADTVITEDMIDIKSPGQGLQPNRKDDLIGRSLSVAKAKGDFFFNSDLAGKNEGARDFEFDQVWGIPVRYHDLNELTSRTNLKMVEIHLSYKDLEEDFRHFITEPYDLDLVVHAPELFAGDHTLDLCSEDDEYRSHSIRELQRVIDLTRELAPFFRRSSCPPIVVNVGGFTSDAALPKQERGRLYDRAAESFARLDTTGVELIPQTMPPFPWHFGGQQFHNIFMDADEIASFCEGHRMRVCLDISHSKLACTHSKVPLSSFLKLVAPYTAHYHIADAAGVDGEGLQINDGEVEWQDFVEKYATLSPNATFIPEIWQGHKNGGEGAWIALNRLEAHFRKQEKVAKL